MSFRSLLAHRATVLRVATDDVDGAPSYTWPVVARHIPCRVDLSYLRMGKDQGWVAEAGRPTDRQGVAFFLSTAPVQPGDRIQLTSGGLTGTFELQGNLDHVLSGDGTVHHIEVGVIEVAHALVEP